MTINPVFFYIIISLFTITVITILVLTIGRFRQRPTHGLSSLENIQRELQKLNQIFTVPHIRGGIGETMLEELLKNWLANGMYHCQYSFRNGERVDAVIHLGDFLVAVDAKFPLESIRRALDSGETDNFPSSEVQRSIQKHVRDISSKYIHPEEGTLQFALMYIPSEKIYYHLFVDSNSTLYEESLRQGVVPVSPSGIFLYIQTVAYGLKGLSLQEGEKNLAGAVYQIRKDLHEYIKVHNTLGTHIKNIVKSYEEGIRRLSRVEQSIEKLHSGNKE